MGNRTCGIPACSVVPQPSTLPRAPTLMKVKGKVFTPWRHMGELRYSSNILDLGTRWRWVVSFILRPLYPRYPLGRRLGGPQSRSGSCGEEKNVSAENRDNLNQRSRSRDRNLNPGPATYEAGVLSTRPRRFVKLSIKCNADAWEILWGSVVRQYQWIKCTYILCFSQKLSCGNVLSVINSETWLN
jgi:hypothetical protein